MLLGCAVLVSMSIIVIIYFYVIGRVVDARVCVCVFAAHVSSLCRLYVAFYTVYALIV